MSCSETRRLLDGYLDGELDLVHSLEFEEHVRGCATCAKAVEHQRALSQALRTSGLRHRAPAGLEAHVRAALAVDTDGEARVSTSLQAIRPAAQPWPWKLLAVAASVVFFGLLAWQLAPMLSRASAEEILAQQVLASHLRSLQLNHLADIPSTDQHTVKPWFAGKLDYSPPVQDLAAQGFALAGGRLDYLDGRAVAALVYQRRQHVINLIVWPAISGVEKNPVAAVKQGYNLVHWTHAGMTYWAVSDLNAAELREFVELMRGQSR